MPLWANRMIRTATGTEKGCDQAITWTQGNGSNHFLYHPPDPVLLLKLPSAPSLRFQGCLLFLLSLPSLFLFAFLPVMDHFPVNFPAKILFPPCLYFSPEPVSGLFQGPHPVRFSTCSISSRLTAFTFLYSRFYILFPVISFFKDPKFAEYIICDHIDNRSCQFTEHLINKPSVSPQFYHHNH